MNTSRNAKPQAGWLYDGKPEFVEIKVSSATAVEGGYVMALQLTTGAFRLAATRHPAQYVNAWRHNVRRFGLPDIVRVLVSRPYLRYESVKRSLARMLLEHKDRESDAYRLGVEALTEKACQLFALAAT